MLIKGLMTNMHNICTTDSFFIFILSLRNQEYKQRKLSLTPIKEKNINKLIRYALNQEHIPIIQISLRWRPLTVGLYMNV